MTGHHASATGAAGAGSDADRPSKGLVVIVEDEPAIADILKRYLTREGFSAHIVGTGNDAIDAVGRLRPVAVILDIGLPDIDGTQVCQRLRAGGDTTPILFVTARDDEIDRVLGLELGGDDYITKPFSPREVVARVRAVLRRSAQAAAPGETLRAGSVTVDVDSRTVRVRGAVVSFTTTEFDLLAHLMRQPGRVFSREELLSSVWGYGALAGTRTVDVHVAQVRAKLDGAIEIRTVRGVGYGLA